jgi:NitT/TauT family transport system substrate-binding protein
MNEPSRHAGGRVFRLLALLASVVLLGACSSSALSSTGAPTGQPSTSSPIASGVSSASTAPSALAPASAAPAASSEADTPINVRVGYLSDYTGADLVAVATDQKLWEKHGLVPNISPFTNGPIEIQSLVAGDLDVGNIGPGAIWLGASGKATIVSVAELSFADAVIARPDKGISTVADLKGKKIGVPQGTSGEMILQAALAKAGLTEADVTILNMDPDTIVSAFVAGQIDAAGTWYPYISEIVKRVPDTKVLLSDGDLYPGQVFPSSYIAGNDVIKSNPELVTRYVEVIQDYLDWRIANPAADIAITSKFLNAPVADAQIEAKYAKFLSTSDVDKFVQDGTIYTWYKQMEDTFVKFGQLTSVADPKTFVNTSLWDAALARR